MPIAATEFARRDLFTNPRAGHEQALHEAGVLTLLLAHDGSTTRLCEALAGGAVQVRVLKQDTTADVPPIVRAHLPGSRFIERVSSLCAQGVVMSDNLSYIALQDLEESIEHALREGATPIGHLLPRWWVRRTALADDGGLARRLWGAVGLPDAQATRTYRIDTPQSPRMLITETYRRGMLMRRSG